MVYKNYRISVWTSEWAKRRMGEVGSSFDGWRFCGIKEAVEEHKYIALAWHVDLLRLLDVCGGATPTGALDSVKYSIDLLEHYRQGVDSIE